jgi:aspartyl protease family protein
MTQQNGRVTPVLRIKADHNGQFHAIAAINGASIITIVDTGASAVSLSYDDAIRLKFDPRRLSCDVGILTANGETCAARVKLGNIRLGTIAVRDVDGLVAQRGALQESLLGMSFLSQARLRIERGGSRRDMCWNWLTRLRAT